MIYSIEGLVSYKDKDFLAIKTGNLAYQVFVINSLTEKTQIGQNIKLFTYLEVREDLLKLYGFELPEELSYFKQLISVSSIGPRTALNILSLVRLSDLEKAISQQDDSILTKISGIGRKTAERIILELKGKTRKPIEGQKEQEDDSLIIDALVSMGYNISQARQIVKKIPAEIIGAEKRLKQALKLLSGK